MVSKNSQHKQSRTFILILIVISCLLFIYKVGDRDLWAPDEDEYAQMSREMIRTNNWMFPTVNGEPWTVKPVLYNWLVSAVSLPWGDVNEFRARIFSALSALGTVLTTYYIGRLAFSAPVGFLGALMLATSLLFVHHGRWAQTYVMSTFFATLAIFLFFRGYRVPEKRSASYLMMYAAVGFGVLTMGPVNLAIPALVVFFYLVFSKDLVHIKDLKLGWGILIFMAIALPWYIAVSLQGGYAFDLIIWTNLSRYFSTGVGHARPIYYYLLNIPWGFFPWSIFLPGAFLLAFSLRSNADKNAIRFLLVWIISLFLFFSFSKGKRPQYIFSIYPALALLVGYLGDRAMHLWEDKFYRRAISIPSVASIAGLVILAVALPVGTHLYYKDFFGVALGVSAVMATFGILLWFAWRKNQPRRLILLPAAFIVVFIIFAVHVLIPKLEEYKSPRQFCDVIVDQMEEGADWAMYKFYRAIYVYYTDSFVKVIETEQELKHFLDRPNRAVVAMREEEYRKLTELITESTTVLRREQIGRKPMILISNRK